MNHALTVLLVEDNPDDLLLFNQAYLKANVGGVLKTVRHGYEAMAYLKGEGAYYNRAQHPFPDVMLLDLKMPQMNGFEVLEWVRKNRLSQRLTVHILTTSAREDDVNRAHDLHANSYLVKPSRVDELVALIKTLHDWHRFTALPRRPGTTMV